jgi:hypothetical protein
MGLAEWLVRRSPWVRLALRGLASGHWSLPRGVGPLRSVRMLRVGHDLRVEPSELDATHDGAFLLGDGQKVAGAPVQVRCAPECLSPLHSPLYLLLALGWLDERGQPALPDHLAAAVLLESPARVLRRLTREEADPAGFVVVERMGRGLWSVLHGASVPRSLAQWIDTVFGRAIESGTIEVHAWAPGQPRHGRGLYGDRDRKLVRWSIHDDFSLAASESLPPHEVEP